MDTGNRVTVTDIEIPFGRLIIIFIKWGLAAIRATIIVGIILSMVMAVLGGVFSGMGLMMGGFGRY